MPRPVDWRNTSLHAKLENCWRICLLTIVSSSVRRRREGTLAHISNKCFNSSNSTGACWRRHYLK